MDNTKVKNAPFFTEVILTCLAIFSIFIVFRNLEYLFWKFSVIGMSVSVFVSLILQDKFSRIIRIFIFLGFVCVAAYTILTVIKSTLLYEDVVLIFIRALYLVIIIFALQIFRPEFLNYIQALTIPLIFSHMAVVTLAANMSGVVVASYLTFWIIILRLKFYGLFNVYKDRSKKNYPVHLFLTVIILLIMYLTLLLFGLFVLKPADTKGVFLKTLGGVGTGREAQSLPGKQDAQEMVREAIEGLSLKNSDYDEGRMSLELSLNELLSAGDDLKELEQAKNRVMRRMSKPGLGKEINNLDELVDNFISQKVANRISNKKEAMAKLLSEEGVGFIERSAMSQLLNKLDDSKSVEELSLYKDKLQERIDKSKLSASRRIEFNNLTRDFLELKNFQGAYELSKSARSNINSLANEERELAQEILDAAEAALSSEVISDLKNSLVIHKEKASSSLSSILDDVAKICEHKSEIAELRKANEIYRELSGAGIPEDELNDLRLSLDGLGKIIDTRDFIRAVSGIMEAARKYPELVNSSGLTELLTKEVGFFQSKAIDRIKGGLVSNLAPESRELAKEVDNIAKDKSPIKNQARLAKMQGLINKMLNQGFIDKDNSDTLHQEAEDISQIQDILVKMLSIFRQSSKESASADKSYQEQVSDFLDGSFLPDKPKESLLELTQELNSSDNQPRLSDIHSEIERELEELGRSGFEDESRRIKEIIQKQFELKRKFMQAQQDFELRNKFNSSATQIEQSRSLEEMADFVDSLIGKNESGIFPQDVSQELESSSNLKIEDEGKMNKDDALFLVPNQAVCPVGFILYFKGYIVGLDKVVRDITLDLDWYSSEPAIISIDPLGRAIAIKLGTAYIYARYKGIESRKSMIRVLEEIPDRVYESIKVKLE
ncbi:MAG: hypothetical protein ABIG46_01560 [Candidatus Omnitrophota bacterium]